MCIMQQIMHQDKICMWYVGSIWIFHSAEIPLMCFWNVYYCGEGGSSSAEAAGANTQQRQWCKFRVVSWHDVSTSSLQCFVIALTPWRPAIAPVQIKLQESLCNTTEKERDAAMQWTNEQKSWSVTAINSAHSIKTDCGARRSNWFFFNDFLFVQTGTFVASLAASIG